MPSPREATVPHRELRGLRSSDAGGVLFSRPSYVLPELTDLVDAIGTPTANRRAAHDPAADPATPRTKGWRKPEGAIVVARPTKWGNPYHIADHTAQRQSGSAATRLHRTKLSKSDGNSQAMTSPAGAHSTNHATPTFPLRLLMGDLGFA